MNKSYLAWNLSTRWFHWINFICILLLTFLGLVMMYKSELGITSLTAKIKLKELHVIIGYVFLTNLLVRFICGFFGSRPNTWRQLFFPKPRRVFSLKYYLAERKNKPSYLGHNPLGRLSVIFMYLLLLTMSISGLVRAGTDVYFPPFGSIVAHYVAKPGVKASKLQPYNKKQVVMTKYNKLEAFKHPFGLIHKYCFYLLMLMIVLHIIAVVTSEICGGEGLVSAMFTGKKVLHKKPLDEE